MLKLYALTVSKSKRTKIKMYCDVLHFSLDSSEEYADFLPIFPSSDRSFLLSYMMLSVVIRSDCLPPSPFAFVSSQASCAFSPSVVSTVLHGHERERCSLSQCSPSHDLCKSLPYTDSEQIEQGHAGDKSAPKRKRQNGEEISIIRRVNHHIIGYLCRKSVGGEEMDPKWRDCNTRGTLIPLDNIEPKLRI